MGPICYEFFDELTNISDHSNPKSGKVPKSQICPVPSAQMAVSVLGKYVYQPHFTIGLKPSEPCRILRGRKKLTEKLPLRGQLMQLAKWLPPHILYSFEKYFFYLC